MPRPVSSGLRSSTLVEAKEYVEGILTRKYGLITSHFVDIVSVVCTPYFFFF